MNFLTYEFLEKYNNNTSAKIISDNKFNSKKSVQTKLYLSYSGAENKVLVNNVRQFFSEQLPSNNIEWLDMSRPFDTNSTTAIIIRQIIKSSDKFIIIATPHTPESMWRLWEIGIADQVLGADNIIILPIVHNDENCSHKTYIQLYSHIAFYNNKWIIKNPDSNSPHKTIKNWFE